MVFIKEILLNKKQVNIDLRAHHSLQLSPSKPTLSLKTLKRDKDSLKAIHFTNTQVYEYFPDWFRSGSMNSPITQVSIKLDRFIPFKVLQLVCMQKTYPDAYFCMVKNNNTMASTTLISSRCFER
jgi:hypothetical protein